MRTSYYQNVNYQRRRQSRYEKEKTPALGQKLIEQVLTQFVICTFIIGTLLGAKFLGFKQFNGAMEKVKIAITYSPSLDEMAKEAKEVTSALVDRVRSTDNSIEDDYMPEIIIDDEIF